VESARVGIVVRTRDRPFFLERALRDVLMQDLTAWHLVVANDGGDIDVVRDTVRRVEADLGDRVTILDVPRPGGRCVAANLAIRALEVPYVVLHDDDDEWHPSFLTTTAAWLDDHRGDAGVAVPTEIVYERQSEGGGYVETGRVPFWAGMQQITFLDLLSSNRVVPISFLYRRELHDELGYYDETLETVEDWEFYLRIVVAHHIGFVRGEPLAFWRQRPSARDAAANSMFALDDAHRRDETIVRDRALRQYVRDHGAGLPHLVAGILRSELHAYEERARRERSWRERLRRVRERFRRR